MSNIQSYCPIFLSFYFCMKLIDAGTFGGRLQEIEKQQPTWKPKENAVFANRDESEMKRFLGINLQKKQEAQRTGGRFRASVRTPTNGHKGRGGYGTGRKQYQDTSRYRKNYWDQGSNRRGFGSQGNNGKWNWGAHGSGGQNGNRGENNRGGEVNRGDEGNRFGDGNNGGQINRGGQNNHDGQGNRGGENNHGGNNNRGNGPDNGENRPQNRGEGKGGGEGRGNGNNREGDNRGNGNGNGGHGGGGHHQRTRRNALPENFDWRDYSDCQSLDDIRYQECGDCWSVASASVMSDRYCLWTHQAKFFSARQVTTCVYPGEGGCDGGWPKDAMEYYKTKGIVSGGDPTITDQKKGCAPYPDELNNSDKCPTTCDDNSPLDSTKAGDYYEITSKNVTEIMQEIFDYGPVVSIFEVFDDFGYMGTGVYKHVSGASQGYHSIRLIGFGTENGVPYWLAANSWGSEWGDKGYFKILRGQNHCDIESWVTCVYPAEAYK